MSQSKFLVVVPMLDPKEKLVHAIRLPEMKDVTETFYKEIEPWTETKGKMKYQYDNANLLVPHENPEIKNHLWGVKPTRNNLELLKVFSSEVVSKLKKTFSKFQISADLVKKLVEVERVIFKTSASGEFFGMSSSRV